jgi:hypothetical protein
MIVHNVYFSLKDKSEEAKQTLVANCYNFTSKIPYIEYMAAGVLYEAGHRPVNDRDFEVHLLVILPDAAKLDEYGVAPSHLEFIEKNSANWTGVRVFDADSKGKA